MYTEHVLFADIEYRRQQARASFPRQPAPSMRSRRSRGSLFRLRWN